MSGTFRGQSGELPGLGALDLWVKGKETGYLSGLLQGQQLTPHQAPTAFPCCHQDNRHF
jgi:hypothetical protein